MTDTQASRTKVQRQHDLELAHLFGCSIYEIDQFEIGECESCSIAVKGRRGHSSGLCLYCGDALRGQS